MKKLTKDEEAALIGCLRAMEAGVSSFECLQRFPEHADRLRPHLELYARLHGVEVPAPPAPAVAQGRQALLERLAREPAGPRRPLVRLLGWAPSNAARAGAASAVVLVLAAGALGGAAAAGVGGARDAISLLPVIQLNDASDNAPEGPDNADDGIGNAPDDADTGRDHADDAASEGSDNAPDELPVPTGLPVDVPAGPPDELPIPTRTPPDGGPPADLPIPTRTPPDGGPPFDPPGGPNGVPQGQPPDVPTPAGPRD